MKRRGGAVHESDVGDGYIVGNPGGCRALPSGSDAVAAREDEECKVSEEQHVWERMDDEPDLWYGRFSVYLRMGTKRSANAVFRKENNKKQQETTTFPGPTWYEAEKTWRWKDRAKAYDDHVRAEEDRIIAEEKEKVLRSGYALMHRRVKELDRLARKLVRATGDESKIWLAETRTFRTGEETTATVEKVQFNGELFREIREYLTDIADEMGERVKTTRQEHSGSVDLAGSRQLFAQKLAQLRKQKEAKESHE